eukprot:CAMPEP_0176083928 /NCGR_PEP_ID=MMETSP0120_2-20121206/41995_1 /TAXON_ID=160619 /ORGANISM="Kryptoperidinium foliaceum, Strain CCMP 1326" /LENGTH=173 /DNA_ID=CAMNT_0017417723 /DNA_START=18 /DNA_END=540 /DNA_ORIENTATION=-
MAIDHAMASSDATTPFGLNICAENLEKVSVVTDDIVVSEDFVDTVARGQRRVTFGGHVAIEYEYSFSFEEDVALKEKDICRVECEDDDEDEDREELRQRAEAREQRHVRRSIAPHLLGDSCGILSMNQSSCGSAAECCDESTSSLVVAALREYPPDRFLIRAGFRASSNPAEL